MRKLTISTLIVTLAVGLGMVRPAGASDATGTILWPQDGTRAESERLAACAVEMNGDAGQGIFGYVVDVTPAASWRLTAVMDRPLPSHPGATIMRRGHFAIAFYSIAPTCTSSGQVLVRYPSFYVNQTVPDGATVGIVTLEVAWWPGVAHSCSIARLSYPRPEVDTTCPGRYHLWLSQSAPGATFSYTESPVAAPSPSPTPTTTAQPTVHVADVSATFSHVGKKGHRIVVSAMVADESGTPVAGADVDFSLTSPEGTVYTGGGTTDETGTASYSVQQNSGGHGEWQACVGSVTAEGYTYDSNANTETCTSVAVT